jgi:hypothetical protein
MESVRKITVEVPERLLESAQNYTGEGITATVTKGLQTLTNIRAQQELLKLRGKVKFSLSWQEMKGDDE